MIKQSEKALICTNDQVGPNLYVMELEAPALAASIQPGQFVHAKLPDMEAHILRRPFSIYAASPKTGRIEILYQVIGFGTDHMTKLKCGKSLDLLGPLGTPWSIPRDAKKVLLVAGGVGAAPLFMLAKGLISKGLVCDIILGAQTKAALVYHERYSTMLEENSFEGKEASSLSYSTDDGSFGRAGFCTTLVEEALSKNSYDYAAVCGPEAMMKIVSKLVLSNGTFCELSLERRMACGIGACLSCVVETSEGLKRACVDGPVFAAEKVVFA